MNRWHFASLTFAMAGLVLLRTGYAGTLEFGRPTVEGEQYTIPVVLRGGDGRVAALDFRLRYDPVVFQPVSTATGPAARQSDKVVTANTAAPGEYVVVMMGLNQNTLDRGEVARVVLRRVGRPETGVSDLTIAEPTLATADGVELPAQGMTWSLELDAPDEEAEEDASAGDDTESDAETGDETVEAGAQASEDGRVVSAVVREIFSSKGDNAQVTHSTVRNADVGPDTSEDAAKIARPGPIPGPIVPRTSQGASGQPEDPGSRENTTGLPQPGDETMAAVPPERAGQTIESENNQVASAPPLDAVQAQDQPASDTSWMLAGAVAVLAALAVVAWWWRGKRTG